LAFAAFVVVMEIVMQRILWLIVGFSLLVLTCASAEIYRCRTPDGVLVMTDQRAKLPADCKPVDEPEDAGSFNIMPSATGTDNKSQPAPSDQKAATKRPDVAPWQSDASALVENYKDAVRRRNRESLDVDGRRATQEVGQLHQQKQEMLNDLAGSGLKHEDQQAIRKTLHEIPQR
jgi:hypothetical protein